MSVRRGQWTRRQFAQAVAASAVATSTFVRGASALTPKGRQGFAFVGTSTADPIGGSIRVYRINGSEWRAVHHEASASPASLLLHPTLPVLYVVHDVAVWDNLPRGAVSAYAFDAGTGGLSLRTTQPLSLAATHPRHAVITADGDALVVSAESGGIYNLLPMTVEGDLARVSAIRKEYGLQAGDAAKIAAPGHMVLGADGSIFAADAGQETVTRFDVQQGGLAVRHRARVHAGAGPSSICMSSCRQRAYVLRAAGGLLSVHDVDAGGLSPAKEVHTLADGGASLLVHPEGRFLIAAGGGWLQVLRVDRGSGRLTLHSRSIQPGLELLRFTADGTQMVGMESASGEVMIHTFDPASGAVSASRMVALESGVTSLLMWSA